MSASKKGIGSDFAKTDPAIKSDMAAVDAYENTAADYEEIPELDDAFFDRAVLHINGVPVRGRPPLGDRPKKQVTLRLDQDVLEHFRGGGAGWQSRINEALRKSLDPV